MHEASDTSLKKKKEWDGERAFQKSHYQKKENNNHAGTLNYSLKIM